MLRWFFTALMVIPLTACARGNGQQIDPCERAVTRLVDECGFDAEVQGGELHCTGQSACIAVCLEQSPCEDISHNDGQYADCIASCGVS